MRKKMFFAIIFLAVMFAAAAGIRENSNDKTISRSMTGLDTVLTITVYDCNDESVFNDAFSEINRLEKILSAELENSDIDRLNKNSGGDFIEISPETWFLLNKSAEYSGLSGGAFDVTIGPLISCWNIKKHTGHVPSSEELDGILPLINYKNMKLRDGNLARLGIKGMKVNLGAIAKGFIADEVKELLISRGVKSAIINLGGNIVLLGEKGGNGFFKVGIQNPLEKNGGYLGFVEISDKSLVSSGSNERFFTDGGKTYHHILDPKTGFPADNELLQTTVITDESVDGDALTTTTFLLGLEKGMELIENTNGAEGIFVTKENRVYLSTGITNFTLTDNKYEIASISHGD